MKKLLKILGFLLVASCGASGQTPNGSITGTVQDMFGAVIPNVEVRLVRLSKDKEETIQQTTSDFEGGFTFSNIPLGVYEARVKWFSERILRKRTELTSLNPMQKNIKVSNEPCSDEPNAAGVTPITNYDRAEIIKELVNLKFPQPVTEKIVFVPRNIDLAWLGAEQKAKLKIMTRGEVQALAEKNNGQSYYWVSPLKQTGGCVEVSMNEDVAIKGDLEDANMAGGGMIYEFKKNAGRWIGQAIGGWIS